MGSDDSTFEIFYVDDSKDDLFYLEYVRRRDNIPAALSCYADADTAYAALETRLSEGSPLPSVLVADLYMAPVGGADLILRIRADGRLSKLKAGICSGSDAIGDREAAATAGADFYVGKPLDMVALMNSFSP
ncbi:MULTISPECIES: hypothetical protein [unclassified Sinorhizobium]|uniref:hypothetical protein n=1 Tax=unclassified Sinorhizobium TaxID=2613772 RepID=UPI0035235582